MNRYTVRKWEVFPYLQNLIEDKVSGTYNHGILDKRLHINTVRPKNKNP